MPDLLLAPGLNCTGELFQPQIAGLPADVTAHVINHRDDLSIEEIADRALAKAPPRFALAGLSMGGYIAYEILRQAPQRVTRLALLDTRASPDSEEDRARRRETITLAESGRFDEVHEMLWPRLVHPDRRNDEALEALVRRMAQETGAAAFVRQQMALLSRRAYREVIKAVRVPTLVIVGEQDLITPPAQAEELAGLIQGCRLVRIPRCGHLSTLEQPDVVNAEFRNWLAN
jgi:pimeloyl-ACP methyl ester carboxylesterase